MNNNDLDIKIEEHGNAFMTPQRFGGGLGSADQDVDTEIRKPVLATNNTGTYLSTRWPDHFDKATPAKGFSSNKSKVEDGPIRASSLPPSLEQSYANVNHSRPVPLSAGTTPILSHAKFDKFDAGLSAANAITTPRASNGTTGDSATPSISRDDMQSNTHNESSNSNNSHPNNSDATTTFVNNAAAAAAAQEYESSRVSAYARLDFESFTFYVQTLQVILGRRAENGNGMVDVHLGSTKAISRRHAKIFYNFGTQRFELSVLGRNGAFVGDVFVETGSTVPLSNGTKIQIGQIPFTFVLPSVPGQEKKASGGHDEVVPKIEDMDHDEAHNIHADMGDLDEEDGAHVNYQQNQAQTNTQQSLEPIIFQQPSSDGSIGGNRNAPPSSGPRRISKPKKEYLPEEIPEEYREKPNQSYSQLIAAAMRSHSPVTGMSLGDIYKAIQDIFPYYKYCPSGWQNSVRHNLSSNKAFKKVSKEGKGWLWGIDEEYFNEKERQKQRAQAKARSANGLPPVATGSVGVAGSAFKKEKTIAELAREIKVQHRPATLDRLYHPEENTAAAAAATGTAASGWTSINNDLTQPPPPPTENMNIPTDPSLTNSASQQHQQRTSLAAGQWTFRTRQSVSPVDHVASVSQSNTGAPAPTGEAPASLKAGANKPQLPLSHDTIKALAVLRKKVLTQMEAMGLPPPNVTVLTNALAMAIAQAAKNNPGGVSALLNGKNPAQLTQVLQVALKEVLGKRQSAPGAPSTSAGVPAAPTTPGPGPPVEETPPTIQTAIEEARASIVGGTPAAAASSVSPPQPPAVPSHAQQGTATNVSQLSPTSTAAPAEAAEHKPTASSTVEALSSTTVAALSSAPPPVSVSVPGAASAPAPAAVEIPVPESAATRAGAAAPHTTAGKTVQPSGPTEKKPSVEAIVQLLEKTKKIPNPSPEVKAMIEKLRAHLASLKRPHEGDTTEEPPTKQAKTN